MISTRMLSSRRFSVNSYNPILFSDLRRKSLHLFIEKPREFIYIYLYFQIFDFYREGRRRIVAQENPAVAPGSRADGECGQMRTGERIHHRLETPVMTANAHREWRACPSSTTAQYRRQAGFPGALLGGFRSLHKGFQYRFALAPGGRQMAGSRIHLHQGNAGWRRGNPHC